METVRKIFKGTTGSIYWNLFICFFQDGHVHHRRRHDHDTHAGRKDMRRIQMALTGGSAGRHCGEPEPARVIAVNLATYIGYKKKGLRGSVCATLGVVLPSFIVIILVGMFIKDNRSESICAGCH